MRGWNRKHPAGVSLVEAVVAVGVLAVIIPLGMAALVKAGDVGGAARAETRAPAIAEQCLVELKAVRDGVSPYFPASGAEEELPAGGAPLVLGFGSNGGVIGRVETTDFENGVRDLNGEDVYYLASVTSRVEQDGGGPDLVTVAVSVEYPAVKKAAGRGRVVFHTQLP